VRSTIARIHESILDSSGSTSVSIKCPKAVIPAPGQYLHAWSIDEPLTSESTILFASQIYEDGFKTDAPVPISWGPGTNLELIGPLGNGFKIPDFIRHMILVTTENSIARLLPIINIALEQDIEQVLFTDCEIQTNTSALEILPLFELGNALSWGEFLCIDTHRDSLNVLIEILEEEVISQIPESSQILIKTSFPCRGLASCGACFVPVKKKWKYICRDGPVFNLKEIVQNKYR